jgi:hypothetical protein
MLVKTVAKEADAVKSAHIYPIQKDSKKRRRFPDLPYLFPQNDSSNTWGEELRLLALLKADCHIHVPANDNFPAADHPHSRV